MMNIRIEKTGTAAQRTLINAMCEWWMASNKDDALAQIAAAPGQDLAGITNSVVSGLVALAEALRVPVEVLTTEENLSELRNATAEQIVFALDSIHQQWIEDNFSEKRWAQKYFKGQLGQYRKTSKIGFTEAIKDLLFIAEFLKTGGSPVTVEEVEVAYQQFAKADASDDDLVTVATRAREQLDPEEVLRQMKAFRDSLDPEKKADLISKIDAFIQDTPEDQVIDMLLAAVK